jgi:hypothetical protein
MKKGLTKRERTLVVFACLLVVFYGAIQFAILPAYRGYTDAVAEYDRLELEKTNLEDDLRLEDLETAIFDAQTTRFFENILSNKPYVSIVEVQKELTAFCESHGFGEPSSVRMSNYERPKEGEPGAGVFVTVTLDMSFECTYDDLIRLINAVKPLNYLRIGRVSYSFGESTSRMNVFFVYTMLEPADIMLAPPSEEPSAQTA